MERKPVMGLPTSARPRERAVRKMVSPSGILLDLTGEGVVVSDRQRNAAQVHAERAGIKSRVHRKRAMKCAVTGWPLMVVMSTP